MNILVTGGAGFIGTHLTRRLIREGCHVAVYDNFHPQVHGADRRLAHDLENEVELCIGDVCDRERFHAALHGRDAVVHLAAETGTGQSMYEVVRYQEINIGGTAILMDFLTNGPSQIEKVVIASSRAIYGEGKYACREHGHIYPSARNADHMKQGRFEPICPSCSAECAPVATDETSLLHPTSFYGLTKQVQEQMALLYAEALGLSGVALRYQNVYGPGQSLKNPYTGILAIFSTLARENKPIRVFEDGRESRDFVYIDDVVEATWRAIQTNVRAPVSVNVGTGTPISVKTVAETIIREIGSTSEISITGEFRLGDIRHNFADVTAAKRLLHFTPRVGFSEGIRQFLQWCQQEPIAEIGLGDSLERLRGSGFFHSADPT